MLTFLAIALANCGPTNPGIVPNVLAMPNKMPAYLGAMSRLLITAPTVLNPENPRDNDRNAIAHLVVFP